MSWPLEYPGASPETWIDWYRRELAKMTEPIEKDPHPLLAENRQLRAELDDLKSTNARLRGLFSNRAAESGQLWEELWQEFDERNKMRADNVRLRERLKGSDMLAHVRGEQIERLTAARDAAMRVHVEDGQEIERLRALVRSAYAEGFSEGMNEHTKFNGGKPWEDSRARRALGGK